MTTKTSMNSHLDSRKSRRVMKTIITTMMNTMRMKLVIGTRLRRVIGKLSIMGIMLMMSLSLKETLLKMSISLALISRSSR